jgi:hypothetical protein
VRVIEVKKTQNKIENLKVHFAFEQLLGVLEHNVAPTLIVWTDAKDLRQKPVALLCKLQHELAVADHVNVGLGQIRGASGIKLSFTLRLCWAYRSATLAPRSLYGPMQSIYVEKQRLYYVNFNTSSL